ncbi:MAG: hypothetical protein AAGA34_01545, partial [Pseudomonadota bacterium]
MHRLFALTSLFCTALLAVAPLHAGSVDRAALDALVVANQRDNEPGLSVAISIDGELAYHGWAGQANLEHHVPI